MRNRLPLALAAMALPSAAAAQESPPVPIAKAISDARADTTGCKSNDPAEVVVCGRSQQRSSLSLSI